MGLNRPCGIGGRDLPPTGPHPLVRRNGHIELMTLEEKEEGLRAGRIARAFDPNKGWEYAVAEEAFDECAEHIYRYESQQALARIERSCQLAKFSNIELKKRIFQKVETAIIARFHGRPKNYRHLSFMLRELSNMGCDYLTATGALLHNIPHKEAERIIFAGQKSTAGLRRVAEQILDIVQVFNEMNGIHYSPPHKKLQHHIQNFMDALIKISRGNGRALLLYFIHKLSAVTLQTEDAGDITFKSVEEFIAPSAERLGLILLASKLRNEAFRLNDPLHYAEMERGIVESLGMSRKQAEDDLAEVRKKLEEALAQAGHTLVQSSSRIKTPWGARAKSDSKEEYKVQEFSDILLMEDLRACRAVTTGPLSLTEAKKFVRQALGSDFARFAEDQTETKVNTLGGRSFEVLHIGAVLKNGDSIEFQLMEEAAYQAIERGFVSHWAYKLELLTGQQFDRDFLEECAKEMNGDIINDAAVIYLKLKAWIYVFFLDPRYSEGPLRVIRRLTGSIPMDVVPWVIGSDISKYAGATKRKIWDTRTYPAREDQPLEDGDFLELNPSPPLSRDYLNPAQRKRLGKLSQVLLTKYLLHFFGDEEAVERAVQIGEGAFLRAAGRPIVKLSGFDDFARKYYNMNNSALLAAIGQDLIATEDVLEEYKRFILAELASK